LLDFDPGREPAARSCESSLSLSFSLFSSRRRRCCRCRRRRPFRSASQPPLLSHLSLPLSLSLSLSLLPHPTNPNQTPPKPHHSRTAAFKPCAAAKQLHFNRQGEALKKMQAGVDKLATVVGVTLGPKGRNVVLESKYGSPKIVNDGVTVAKEVELEDPVENIGAKLVRQAASKTNDTAGDGTTTATILSAAIIAEGMKIVAAGTNPVQLTRGIEKTVAALVKELAAMSAEVSDADLANVATVSAGGNEVVGGLISDAMARVGRAGVVTMEESRTAEDNLYVVEGMQFERG